MFTLKNKSNKGIDCQICEGKGYIREFGGGKKRNCINCESLGYIPHDKSNTIKYAKGFIEKFKKNTIFNLRNSMRDIQTIEFIGHPTMELKLLVDSQNYYIAKPNINDVMWYKIPKNFWRAFKKSYNKINKKSPIL